MKKTNLTTKILLIFIIAMVFFVGTACASTITNSEVDNTNVYGSTAYYDISASSSSGSTATNIVHISGEYIYIEGLTASPTQGSIGETITFTPVNRRGAAVYLTNGTIVEGIEMSYGAGGTMVGTNIFTASYSTNGEKTPSLTLKGYDGTNIVTLNPVTATVKIGFITALTVNGDTTPVYVGYNQTANVAVTASGTSLTYHWYATTTPSDSSSWSDSYFASPTSASTTFSTNSGAGAYSIKVVVSNGTMSEDSYDSQAFQRTINVVAPPTVEQPTISATTTPTTNTNLNGTLQKTFYVSVAPTSSTYGTVSYQWYEGENAITGLTGYSNQSITVNDSTNTTHTYHVVVTVKDAGGTTLNTVTSNNVTYKSFAVPQFESTPITTSSNVIQYDVDPTATLTAHATSGQGDSLKYNWEYNYNQTQWESFGTPDNPSSSVVFDATELDLGTYQFRVTVSGYGGSVTSTTAVTINVITTPPTVQQPTISATTTASTNTSLSGTLQNTFYVSVAPVTVSYGVVSYQWYEGNNPISGLTGYSNQLISVNDSTNTTHTYHVVVTVKDSYGTTLHTVTSNDVTYKSFAPPQFDNPNNPVTASTNTIVYDVDPTAVLTAHTDVAEGDVLKYNWQYNLNQTGWVDFGTVDSPVNTVTFDATGLTLGTYQFRVTVTGYGGSINNNTHLVTINVVGAGASTAQPLLGAVNEEYQLSCTSINYDSLYWYYSLNGSSYNRIDDSYNQKTYYYTPTQAGEYRFKAICTYGTEDVETDPSGLVYVVGKQTLNVSPNILFVNDDLTVELSNPAYGIPSAVTPVVTWKINGESVTLTTTQTTSRLITYSYTPTTRGSKTLQGTIVYTDSARGLSYTETVSASFTVYQTPTASVSPIEGGLSTNFSLTATNTDFGTITWQISSDNVTFTDISSPLAPSSSAFTYQPTQGMTAGTYYIKGYVQWTNPAKSSYTNVSQIHLYAVPPTPTVLIDGQSSKTVLSSNDLSFALSLNNYSPVSGDSYSYVWKYSKDGGSQTTIATTTTSSTSFDFSSLGLTAGTYDITVTVTGKGGSTTSNASKLYVIGLSNVTVSKGEMGTTETATTSVQISGISTVQYHWYAKLGSGEWSDTFFGSTAQSASATFTPTNAGIYTFKVVISGTFGTLDSYTDAGITNVTTTAYNAPQTPTILIDGQSSKTILASAATSVALSIPNYPTPAGDSYSFVWKYSKNGGSQQTIATTTTASTTFALSSLGAGTYEISVTVTGKGGSTSSSVSAMLYIIGLSNVTISKTEMGMTETATTSVQISGISTVQYHWYAKLGSGEWSDTFFGSTAQSASATFTPTNAGIYTFKVVISGTFGTLDSYTDAGITNVTTTAYNAPQTPTILIDGQSSKTILASAATSVALSIPNYPTPTGDSYSFVWKYSKNGGSQQTIATTTTASTTFALSSLGAGTYEISVTVTGKGGSTSSSVSAMLYIIGLSNVTISKSEMGMAESATTSVQVEGITNVQYHWYAKLNNSTSQWDDSYFGASASSASGTFSASVAGTYVVKVVISGTFGTIDSYTDAGITNVLCTVYSPPPTPTVLIDGEMSKVLLASTSMSVNLSISNYAPPQGDSYSYEWRYVKDGGVSTVIGTTQTATTVFALSSLGLGAGTYDITVTVTGKGGSAVSSASKLYVVGISNLNVSQSSIGVGDSVGVSVTVSGFTNVQYHWYNRIVGESQWVDTNFGSTSLSQTATFTPTTSGKYEFKVVVSGDFGSIDSYTQVGITTAICDVYYIPTIQDISVSREVDDHTPLPYSVRIGLDAHASISSYSWKYSTNNGTTWTEFGTTADGEHIFDAGVYQIKMVAQTNEGYTLTSEIFLVNVIEITMSASATEVSNTQVVTFSGTASNLIADKNYECILQISTDNVNWQNIGLSTSLSSNYSKNYVFTHTGTYYVRLHAWDNSEFDYYSYDNVVISVVAPPEIFVTINKTSGETAEEVTLTATVNNSSSNLSYEWYYSTNNGSSWTATGNHNLTYTTTPSGNPLTLYKVIASSTLYSNINSNVVGYIITSNLTPTTSASSIGTSSSDAYIIPLKTQFPYEIIDVFAISGGVGLVVTEHALYLIDGNIKEGTTNVLATLPVSYGKIKSCKYYNEHLICQTTDGRIIIQTIVGSSNFGASMEILGYTGTVTDYDVSQANYMIACQGVGVYTYDINGDLQWFIEDTTSTTFAATKVSSDYNLEYVILAGSPSSTTLTAYTGESTKLTIEVPTGIQSIQTITYDVPKFIVVTNNNTLIYNYTLTVNTSGTNNFSFGNYVSVPYKLSALSSARNGSLFAGVLANTFYVIDANGSLVGTYPTSGTLTDSDLAKLTTNMAITGGVSGQVSILQNSGSWEGLQSFPMPNSTRSLSMADSGTVFFAATPNTVYNAIQKSSSDDRETILTTTYYLKIGVHDANGGMIPNASVRVVSVSGTSMYTTDSTGTVTIEVIPTRTYTISLANGEDSKVYIADNYALQHLELYYPAVTIGDKITTNAYVTENKYLNVEFKNTGNTNMYNMTVKILDSYKNILFTETKVTNDYENRFTASHLSIDNKTFIVQINATPIGDYNNPIEKSFVLEIKNESPSGTITLGTIPLLPDSMDDKWKTLIFGGLIMIIGGLFSYNHSIRGCVLMAIIAAVMTFLGLLPISPVWIACMVVLAFLTLYAWASQNEG